MKNILLLISIGLVLISPILADLSTQVDVAEKPKSDLANVTLVEQLYNSSKLALDLAQLELSQIPKDKLFDLDRGVTFQFTILRSLVAELHDRLEAKSLLLQDYVKILTEQLISAENSLGEQYEILKQVLDPQFNPKYQNRTEQAQAILAQAQNILNKYPNSREIPAVKNEIENFSERFERSMAPRKVFLARVEKSLNLLEEKASYRLPIQFQVLNPRNVPENVNISQQLTFFTLLSTSETAHSSLNKSYHSKLEKYISNNQSHLIGAFQYEIGLQNNLLSHLKHQLANSTQYFPPTYIRVLVEEEFRLSTAIDKQDEIVKKIIQQVNSETERTKEEIFGRAKLLQRLAEGMVLQHPHLIEGPAFRNEIIGLNLLIKETSPEKNVTESELPILGQALDRHQATVQYLTESSNWNMMHSGGYL